MSLPVYDVYAIRYATRGGMRNESFMGGDTHDGPMAMDYFIWVAIGDGRTILIDTGFGPEGGRKRGREYLRSPVDSLQLVGVNAAEVEDIVLTHLHYDHAGNFDSFPRAKFHLQEKEMHYATSRYMQYPRLGDSFEVDDVCRMVRLNYARRVVFYDGDAELAPGLRLHRVGGHSAGLQFVSVHTQRGWVVLASDTTHYYENLETMRPYPRAFHVGDMLDGFERLKAIAPSLDHIVPGHDPLVMDRYPAPSSDMVGIVVRLDVPPDTANAQR